MESPLIEGDRTVGRKRSEKDRERWRQWQEQEREAERRAQREKHERSQARSRDRENRIVAFTHRLAAMRDVCDHLGVTTRVLNRGLHVQFVCGELIGNYYPTTNHLFIQRPNLGETLGGIKHRDALLAFFRAARDILEVPELYTASWEFDDTGQPPDFVRADTLECGDRLREAVLRVAAKYPSLLLGVSPREFEFLVAELLNDQGYETTVTQASRDCGRDIVAIKRQDWDREYVLLVECKRYIERPVDIGVVQRIVGVRHINRADYAMVVTTSQFTGPALQEARRVREELSLVDHRELEEWLVKYDARRN